MFVTKKNFSRNISFLKQKTENLNNFFLKGKEPYMKLQKTKNSETFYSLIDTYKTITN